MKSVLFYAESDAYGELSNWWPAPIELDGKSEREQIRKASTPRRAEELGRQVRLRRGWDGMKFEVMVIANRAKFTQHRDLHDLLLSTGDRPIHESCDDPWWGGGPTSRTARTCWARC